MARTSSKERNINGGLKRCPTILLRRPRPRLLQQHGNGRKNVESAAIFFLRVEFCEEIIHPPRFVVVFCTKAPGPGGYSVCVHERDYLWDCFSDMVYRFYSHLFVPKTLPPRTVESFKVGNFGGEKTTPLGHFPKTRPLLPPTSLRDVSSFTLSLRSYRTPKLPLYIREFCLRKKIVLLVKRDTITALR